MDHRTRTHTSTGARRGNTLILVAAILALLVIIATAFITRTQSGRVTAVAYRDGQIKDNNASIVGEMIADEIADALFVRPVDPSDPYIDPASPVYINGAGDSNYPRRPIQNDAIRYGVDLTNIYSPFAEPDAPYNIALYHVVPWTNPPDTTGDGFIDPFLPNGAGHSGGAALPIFQLLDNPRGNPGFGDCRWLRDIEPMRWDTNGDGIPDRYSHWRHLTNLSRPGNGWRICRDISDVTDFNGFGGIVSDLSIPVESWLPVRPAGVTTVFDDVSIGLASNFDTWTGNLAGYVQSYTNPNTIPANYYRLSDLDGDGVTHEIGERPQDEFAPGSWRHDIGRYLTDTDGDGYTDAFWHLVPTPIERGIRQIAAVSVIDNSAMVNANVASRFSAWDTSSLAERRKSGGHTPADVALTGDMTNLLLYDGLDLGLFDNGANWESGRLWPGGGFYGAFGGSTVEWNPVRWGDYLDQLGVSGTTGFLGGQELSMARGRLLYWQLAGRQPLDPEGVLTPFTLADEIELRMYLANNYPWIYSRFERAIAATNDIGTSLLHSLVFQNVESSEFQHQLRSREILHDLRSKITMYSGARNETAPPWLWIQYADQNEDGAVSDVEQFQFDRSRLKYDLRFPSATSPLDFNGDGFINKTDRRLDRAFLTDRIARALVDADWHGPVGQNSIHDFDPGDGTGHGYFGLTASIADVNEVRRASASMAANILAYRDDDSDPLRADDALLAVSDSGRPIGFIGMEPQPFILEAYIAHVYRMYTIPDTDFDGTPYLAAHQRANVIFGDPDARGTVVVVQLANPFPDEINLENYQIDLFGQTYALNGVLPPATNEDPVTGLPQNPPSLILYAITDDVEESPDFEGKWRDFLDLETTDHPTGTRLIDLNDPLTGVNSWSVDRDDYDTGGPDADKPPIVLFRENPPDPGVLTPPLRIVVDRIDAPVDRKFGDAVNALVATKPLDPAPLPGVGLGPDDSIIADNMPYPLGTVLSAETAAHSHWVQWVRATRAWGVDLNRNGWYERTERNPRYVFAERAVVQALSSGLSDRSFTPGAHAGNRYVDGSAPDAWFTRNYVPMRADPVAPVPIQHKPTFFAHRGDDAATYDGNQTRYPDKGWYGQRATQDMQVDFHAVDPTADPPLDGRAYSMQMLVKNADFEQVGELANVFMWGHQLSVNLDGTTGFIDSGNPLDLSDPEELGTEITFSEYMAHPTLAGDKPKTNRRINRLDPEKDDSVILGEPGLEDAVPDLPAAVRVFDAFVCDEGGLNPGVDNIVVGVPVDEDRFQSRFLNAQGFSGQMTPGMININTASTEVLRALPHMYKLAHEATSSPPIYPRVGVAEAIRQYRERLPSQDEAIIRNMMSPPPTLPDVILQSHPSIALPGAPDFPNYADRPARGDRGFASIGELLLLTEPDIPNPALMRVDQDQWTGEDLPVRMWRIDQGALDGAWLFGDVIDERTAASARISVDQVHLPDSPADADALPEADGVAADAEEANLLFGGMSNIVTTRSDIFTVYFRIRSFRQNPTTGVWDATDPEYIVDDSRYVMLVDRSEVNSPNDRPKILYLEKLPR